MKIGVRRKRFDEDGEEEERKKCELVRFHRTHRTVVSSTTMLHVDDGQ